MLPTVKTVGYVFHSGIINPTSKSHSVFIVALSSFYTHPYNYLIFKLAHYLIKLNYVITKIPYFTDIRLSFMRKRRKQIDFKTLFMGLKKCFDMV